MKTLFLILILTFSFNSFGVELGSRPIHLKVASPDNRTDLSKLTVGLVIQCFEKKIVYGGWPDGPILSKEEVSCGQVTNYNGRLNDNNEIVIPALSSLKMFKRKGLNAAFITIFVDNGRENLATLYITGEKGIKTLAENAQPLNFYKFKMQDLKVTLNGEDLFKTNYVKQSEASLRLSFKEMATEDGLALRGGQHHFFYTASNASDSQVILSKIDSIQSPELSFARLGDVVKDQVIEYSFWSKTLKSEKNAITIPLDVGALESIDTIELE